MKKVLPLLADVGHGILAVLSVGLLLEVPLSWHFFVGVLIALLPDVDAIPRLFRTGSVMPTTEDPLDHRDYLHFPVLFIIFGIILCAGSLFWGLVFIVATVLHFLNDTWGTGDGIMWLWPLSRKKYKWSKIDTWKWDFYTNVAKNEKDEWINASYLQITSISIIEYTTFIVAVLFLVLYLLS